MADGVFSKSFRLLSASDFSYLRKNSNFINTPWMRAYYKNSRFNLSETRIGFSVSKKVGKAIVRNRFKRVLREVFRSSDCKFLGKDVLFIVSPEIVKRSDTRKESEVLLKQSFLKILSKISRMGKEK